MSVDEALKLVADVRTALEGYIEYSGVAYYAIQKADELTDHLKAGRVEEAKALLKEIVDLSEPYRYAAPDVVFKVDQLKQLLL